MLPLFLRAQRSVQSTQPSPRRQPSVQGYFLEDSIEIGRPFQYSLTYRHPADVDVLFPDTARHFSPYHVKSMAVFPSHTTGIGSLAVSRDSAVYTLVSFEIDSIQILQVPVRSIHDVDCTAQWTFVDTVFLRSKLPATLSTASRPNTLTLATETKLASLQQQFNYSVLTTGILSISLVGLVLYGLFGRLIRRQWRLYQLNRRHILFLREYNRLSRTINSYTAAETANRAVVMWKVYLERLDKQPYTSMTTPEVVERMNDEHVTDALREADRMIYGGSFSPQSQPALRILSEVATRTYHRRRDSLEGEPDQQAETVSPSNSAETSTFSS